MNNYLFHFWENVIVDEPTTHTFTKGNSDVEWITSKVYVEGENGAEQSIFFELAEKNLWGVNGIWPFALSKEQQTDNNLEGFQVCYPMTGEKLKTNKAERYTQLVFDKMNDITISAMKKFGEEGNLPHPAYSSYLVAKERDDCAYAVKPIYDHPKTTNKAGGKYVDHNKPARAYIKLSTRGIGKNIECFTPIYGTGDNLNSP